MKKITFAQGQRALVEDLNNLHNFTEEEVDRLLRATTSSGTGKVLFDNIIPTAELAGTVLTITVPAQYFAVNGVIVQTSEDVRQITVSAAEPTQVGVFLVAGRQEVLQTRNFTSTDPLTQVIVQQDAETVTQTLPTSRVSYISNSSLVVTIADPVLGATDVGFVKLATVQYDNTAPSGSELTVLGNSTDVYSLPGGVSVPVDDHAATHLPGGGDAIQVAALDAAQPGGSRPGLMPAGAFTAIDEAVLDVQAADTAGYLSISVTGSNVPAQIQTNGRTATIDINRFDSLTVVDDGGIEKLGVAFLQASAKNGTADTAARSDHIHPLADSGLIVQQFVLDLAPALLSTSVAYELTPPVVGGTPVTVAKILSVNVLWQPPNLVTGNTNDGIETGWHMYFKDGQNQTLGARAHVRGTNVFDLEIGRLGACLVTGPAFDFAQDLSNPQYNAGDFAQSGRLIILATAIRAGAVNLVS